MRTSIIFTSICLLFWFGQNTRPAQQPSIILNGETGEYKSLDEIKPVLVNETDKSLYLFPEDCGQARLWLHYMNNNWRESISKDCAGDMIEVKPGKSYQIPALVWRPVRLVERKTFPGKYIIVIRYSLTPISSDEFKPRLKLRALEVSKEFIIAQ